MAPTSLRLSSCISKRVITSSTQNSQEHDMENCGAIIDETRSKTKTNFKNWQWKPAPSSVNADEKLSLSYEINDTKNNSIIFFFFSFFSAAAAAFFWHFCLILSCCYGKCKLRKIPKNPHMWLIFLVKVIITLCIDQRWDTATEVFQGKRSVTERV